MPFFVWHWSIGLLLIALICGLPWPATAVEFSNCQRCHQTELDQAERRFYQHMPFSRQECARCHDAAPAVSPKTTRAAAQRQKAAERKVTWMADSSVAAREHTFTLPSDKLGSTLVVELRGKSRSYPRQEFAVPLLAEIDRAPDSGVPPVLSDVGVLEVKRGVFLSVVIGWRTNVMSTAQIRYGLDSLEQSSDRSQRLGRRHRVKLHALQPDKTYRFQVIATDLNGRRQESEVLTFSTARPQQNPVEASRSSQEPETIALDAHFLRHDGDYLVELAATGPVAMFVGSRGVVRRQAKPAVGSALILAASGEVDSAHSGLSTGRVLMIDACRDCHKNQGQVTHPVNVLPQEGMTIPPEYPTLPNGRITCASCHLTHSSDNEYLAIRPGRRDLCVGCHKDML